MKAQLPGTVVCVCAVKARRKAASDPRRASELGDSSQMFIIFGFVFGIGTMGTLASILVPILTADTWEPSCWHYSYQGSCYRYKIYVGPSGSCDNGVKSSDGYCYSDYCPYYKYPRPGIAYKRLCYKYRTYVGNSSSCTRGRISAAGYCYSGQCSYYEHNNTCYRHREKVSSSSGCAGVRTPDNYCYTYCPGDMYTYRESCYVDKKYVGSSGTCTGVRSDEYCYYTFCPFYEHLGLCYRYYQYVASSEKCYGYGVRSANDRCYYESCPAYFYLGSCYENVKYVGSTGHCNGLRSSDGYCYYDRYY